MEDKFVKVVHLITLLEFGGAQANTIYTVHHLDRRQFTALLWAGKGAHWDTYVTDRARNRDRVRFFRSLVRPLNPFFDVIAIFMLAWQLRKIKPAVLHTHSSKAGILGRIAGKLAGVPVIVHTFHGFGFNDQQTWLVRRLFIALERWTARMAKRLIFVSKANWETAKRLKIGNPKSYQLIRSGINLKLLQDEAGRHDVRDELRIPRSAPLVLTIAAFKPQKNLKDFLYAASEIKKRKPETFFVILGDGKLRGDLENLAREIQLMPSLRMPGWREDAPSFLAAADMFVLTSLWEGLPRALLEAMALGVPPVCYQTDGVMDVLHANEGTMVPQGDVHGLADRVLELLNNKEMHHRLAIALKARIGQEFDIDHMVRQQEDLYRRLLAVDKPH